MPKILRFCPPLLITTLLLCCIQVLGGTSHASEGIQVYYVRYDIKSADNKITNDNLLMVPAKNEFRAENFSQLSVSGTIKATHEESNSVIEKRIRDNALKAILTKNGLRSVAAKDMETVVSYEGVLITPLNILKKSYHNENNEVTYKVQAKFSALEFPDRWENLGVKHKIKELMTDFFQMFK